MPDDAIPPERDEATTSADTYHRHGDADPAKWDEAEAVTGRPVDDPQPNSTLRDRAKARSKEVKAADVEDKAVTSAKTKAPAKKAAAKK